METQSPLPVMPAWQARSFWLTLVGSVLTIAATLNFDLLGMIGVESETALVDLIMQAVGLIAFVWAWFERKTPTRQLSLSPKPRHPEGM